MQTIVINGSQLDNIDVGKMAKQVKLDIRPRSFGGGIVSSTVNLTGTSLSRDLKKMVNNRTEISIVEPRRYPVISSKRFWTIALGGSAGVAAIGGYFAGFGVYGSNNGEFGLYDGYGCQIQTNIGFSSGGEIAYIFGPPSTFSGMAFAIGIDFDIPGVGFGASGRCIFNTDLQWTGISFGVSGGISALPMNFTIQAGDTNLRPIGRFW